MIVDEEEKGTDSFKELEKGPVIAAKNNELSEMR